MFKRALVVYYLLVFLLIPQQAWAMHIADGFLPLQQTLIWWVLAAPILMYSLGHINRLVKANPRIKLLLGLVGAFAFVLSALKLPSITGSSSHPTGVGLGTILFGPWVMAVISSIVLLFQALLLGHGGIYSLGANTFSMGVIGPLVSFGIYGVSKRLGLPVAVSVFLSACLGDLATYATTAAQMAWAVPDPITGFTGALTKFMTVYLFTQVPLAISEGILTVLVFNGLRSYNQQELMQLSVIKGEDCRETLS